MATRFYLSSTATHSLTPGFDGGWTRTADADRRVMSTTKDSSAETSKTFFANGTAAANASACNRQYLSAPLAIGTAFVTSDTMKCYIRCQESAANDNLNRAPVAVKVLASDGTTIRATLKSLGAYGPNTTEWGTSLASKAVLDGDALAANYTTVAGDRLLIELGGQVDATGGTSVTGTQSFGANNASDIAESEGVTTVLNAWFEVSRTFVFDSPVFPGTGVVTATGFEPSIASAPQVVSPGVGALTATGFAPTVTIAAAPSFVQATSQGAPNGSGNWVKAFASNVGNGSTLTVFLTTNRVRTIGNPTDTLGNSFGTPIETVDDVAQGEKTYAWVAPCPTGGADTITITGGNVGDEGIMVIVEHSGKDASAPVRSHNQALQASPGTGANGVVSGSITPSANDDVLLYVCNTQSFATACYSPSTGYTERLETGDGAQALDSALYTKDSVSSGAQTLTCTSALNESVPSIAIAYKPAAVGATITPGLGTLTATGFAPTVTASGAAAVAPGLGVLAVTGFAATVTTTQNKVVTPGLGIANVTGFSPLVTTTPRLYHTTFPLTENPIYESGLWDNGLAVGLDWADISTTPGLAIGHQSASVQYSDGTAIMRGPWASNQWASAVVVSNNVDDSFFEEVEIRLRSTMTPNSSRGYEVFWKVSQSSSAYFSIVRWNGPFGSPDGFTELLHLDGSQYGVKTGDVVTAAVIGSTIYGWLNGTLSGSATDSTYTDGAPGIGMNLGNGTGAGAGHNGDYGFSEFTAGDAIVGAVTPGLGQLTITGFAPTISTGANQLVTPGLGVATLTGFAATVTASDNKTVTPGLGALAATGLAPTVAVSDNKQVAPGLGTATLTGFAPSVSAGGAQTILPGVGVLTATGFAPSVAAGGNVTVVAGLGQLTATGLAPTVTISNNKQVTPGLGVALLTGLAPTVAVSANAGVTPGAGLLTVTGFSPIVRGSSGIYRVGELTNHRAAPVIATAHRSAPTITGLRRPPTITPL